jgi:hypothetical protein
VSQPPLTIGAELASLIESGIAIVVATRDGDMRPQITRAWGASVADDGAALTLCVVASEGSRALDNLRANGAIALTFSRPTTYRTVQVKGVATDLREPTERELTRREEHLEVFLEEVEQVGLERRIARRISGGEVVAVTVAVRELYEQTPGPGAGARL